MGENLKDLLNKIWLIFDKDGSGVLEEEEAKQFIKTVCGPGSGLESREAELMQLMDKDGDK